METAMPRDFVLARRAATQPCFARYAGNRDPAGPLHPRSGTCYAYRSVAKSGGQICDLPAAGQRASPCFIDSAGWLCPCLGSDDKVRS